MATSVRAQEGEKSPHSLHRPCWPLMIHTPCCFPPNQLLPQTEQLKNRQLVFTIFSETRLKSTVRHPCPNEQKSRKSVLNKMRVWNLWIWVTKSYLLLFQVFYNHGLLGKEVKSLLETALWVETGQEMKIHMPAWALWPGPAETIPAW